MDLSNKKLWGSLSLDGIKTAKEKAPKRFKNHEQYGNQMTFDAKQWDDGGITLSVSYQDESGNWQRINVGNIRISKDQPSTENTGFSAPAAATPAAESNDLPF